MHISHSVLKKHILDARYQRAYFYADNGVFTLTIGWGKKGVGMCAFTEFKSKKNLVSFVNDLPEGLAKTIYVVNMKIKGVI